MFVQVIVVVAVVVQQRVCLHAEVHAVLCVMQTVIHRAMDVKQPAVMYAQIHAIKSAI